MLVPPPNIVQRGALRAAAMVWRGEDGHLRVSLCVGATFELVHGEAARLSSIQHAPSAADMVPQKAAVDVLVTADAHSHTAVSHLEVAATVGSMTKSLTITGDRSWIAGDHGVVVGPATLFQHMPLDAERGVQSLLNPAGVGFEQQLGRVLPNIAVLGPGAGIMLPGFQPLSPDVRAALAELSPSQQQWVARGLADGEAAAPDFDLSYFNIAAPEQRIERFEGDQRLAFKNLHPAASHFECTLQVPAPHAVWQADGGTWPIPMRCDSIEVDLTRGVAQLTMRGVVRVDDPAQLASASILLDDSAGAPLEAGRVQVASPRRSRMHTVLADYQPNENDQPLPFRVRVDGMPSSDASEIEEEPDTSRTGSSTPPTSSATPPLVAASSNPSPQRPRTQTVALDIDDASIARIKARFTVASQGAATTIQWEGNDDETRDTPASPRATAELQIEQPQPARPPSDLPFTSTGAFPTPSPPPPAPAPAPTPAPPLVRPPDPLRTDHATSSVPAPLAPAVVTTPAVANEDTTAEPLPPLKVGPLAGSLASEDEAATGSAAGATDADTAEFDADVPLTLERVAAIDAAIDANPEEVADLLEEFGVTQAKLETERARFAEEQKVALHRGDRDPLDRYDAAYVKRLEEQRGEITVEDFAQLELATERDALDAALAELKLPSASVFRIKRIWMKRRTSDIELNRQLRSALKAARAAS